jgi:hypothetical protein
MPSRDDIYRKYGETAEAAHLLETELGTTLLLRLALEANLLVKPDLVIAKNIMKKINKMTLGQLINLIDKNSYDNVPPLKSLREALEARNRLQHTFYRFHNNRIQSDEGRLIMMKNLEEIHGIIFSAYRETMKANGIDLDELTKSMTSLPTLHLPLD